MQYRIKPYLFESAIVSLLLFSAAACRKLVEVGVPQENLVSSSVFSDSSTAAAAVNGIYEYISPGVYFNYLSGGLSLYSGLAADELQPGGTSEEEIQFFSNRILPTNSINLNSLWQVAYHGIYLANACMEGITNSTGITESAKLKMVAEAKCLRATLYLPLAFLYGNCPIVTSTDYQVNLRLPASGFDSIMSRVIGDLSEARFQLPKTINGNAWLNNYWTATALLAKTYFLNADYENAYWLSDEIIESGMYSLASDPASVFLSSSREIIWGMNSTISGFESADGYWFIPGSDNSVPNYILSPSLVSSFDSSDLRKKQWIGKNIADGNIYYYPAKYKLGFDGAVPSQEKYSMIRLAEMYLIRSESAWRLGDKAKSAQDLNIIRSRAGLEALPITIDETALLDSVWAEQRKELMAENGYRWFNLKRTGQMDAVLGQTKEGWENYCNLFPIPESELNMSTQLKQNPGY